MILLRGSLVPDSRVRTEEMSLGTRLCDPIKGILLHGPEYGLSIDTDPTHLALLPNLHSIRRTTKLTQAFAVSVVCSTKSTQNFVLQATNAAKARERGYTPHPSHIIIHMSNIQAFHVYQGSSCSICQPQTEDKERPGNEPPRYYHRDW